MIYGSIAKTSTAEDNLDRWTWLPMIKNLKTTFHRKVIIWATLARVPISNQSKRKNWLIIWTVNLINMSMESVKRVWLATLVGIVLTVIIIVRSRNMIIETRKRRISRRRHWLKANKVSHLLDPTQCMIQRVLQLSGPQRTASKALPCKIFLRKMTLIRIIRTNKNMIKLTKL